MRKTIDHSVTKTDCKFTNVKSSKQKAYVVRGRPWKCLTYHKDPRVTGKHNFYIINLHNQIDGLMDSTKYREFCSDFCL